MAVGAPAVEHDQPVVGMPTSAAASMACGSSGLTVTSIVAVESVSCLTMSLAVNSDVDRGGRRARAQDAVKGDGERRAVRREQTDHVADGDSAIGQCAGERIDLRTTSR